MQRLDLSACLHHGSFAIGIRRILLWAFCASRFLGRTSFSIERVLNASIEKALLLKNHEERNAQSNTPTDEEYIYTGSWESLSHYACAVLLIDDWLLNGWFHVLANYACARGGLARRCSQKPWYRFSQDMAHTFPNIARGYITFFMLNSIQHEIFPAHKC